MKIIVLSHRLKPMTQHFFYIIGNCIFYYTKSLPGRMRTAAYTEDVARTTAGARMCYLKILMLALVYPELRQRKWNEKFMWS